MKVTLTVKLSPEATECYREYFANEEHVDDGRPVSITDEEFKKFIEADFEANISQYLLDLAEDTLPGYKDLDPRIPGGPHDGNKRVPNITVLSVEL